MATTMLLKFYLRVIALLALLHFCLAQTQVCNNSPALCSKAYNAITHLGAHDSPFVRDASNGYTVAGDQFYSSIAQLSSGVRLLTAQVHNESNTWHLCHTSCDLYDAGLLSTWLSGIKTWLDDNPNEVVTILLVNSDNADAGILGPIFSGAGVKSYAYQPAVTTSAQKSWPTLKEMISSGKRLAIFIASLDPSTNTVAPYLLDEFTFVFENNYDVDNPADFSCQENRPASLNGNTAEALSSGRLPLMNHFLYDNIDGIEIPSVENVQNTNAASGKTGNLGAAAKNCTTAYGKSPTFILVDFVNVGPAIAVVDSLNNVTGNTSGRKPLPTTVAGSTNPLGASSTVSMQSSTMIPAAHTTSESSSIQFSSPSSSFSASSSRPTTNSAKSLHPGSRDLVCNMLATFPLLSVVLTLLIIYPYLL